MNSINYNNRTYALRCTFQVLFDLKQKTGIDFIVNMDLNEIETIEALVSFMLNDDSVDVETFIAECEDQIIATLVDQFKQYEKSEPVSEDVKGLNSDHITLEYLQGLALTNGLSRSDFLSLTPYEFNTFLHVFNKKEKYDTAVFESLFRLQNAYIFNSNPYLKPGQRIKDLRKMYPISIEQESKERARKETKYSRMNPEDHKALKAFLSSFN